MIELITSLLGTFLGGRFDLLGITHLGATALIVWRLHALAVKFNTLANNADLRREIENETRLSALERSRG